MLMPVASCINISMEPLICKRRSLILESKRSFILSFLDEVVSVVSAVGEAPKPAFLEGARKTLTTPGSTQSPSMFRDLQQGSPIEADQIIGDLLARGTNAGIPTPLLAATYAHLSVYQQRLARP